MNQTLADLTLPHNGFLAAFIIIHRICQKDEDNEDLLMRQSAPQFLIKDRGDDKSARSSAVSSETATESYNGKNRGNLMLSGDNSAFKSHFQINKKVAAGTTNSSNRIAKKEFQHSRRRRSTRYSISHKGMICWQEPFSFY